MSEINEHHPAKFTIGENAELKDKVIDEMKRANDLQIKCDRLEKENARYREALENIIKHEQIVGGNMARLSTVVVIANKALEKP